MYFEHEPSLRLCKFWICPVLPENVLVTLLDLFEYWDIPISFLISSTKKLLSSLDTLILPDISLTALATSIKPREKTEFTSDNLACFKTIWEDKMFRETERFSLFSVEEQEKNYTSQVRESLALHQGVRTREGKVSTWFNIAV